MKEEYVNKEITRKLIDKGCPVRLVIKADEPIPILYELPKEHPDWQDCKAWYIPTISQVLKWLREEKKIHISINIWGRTWGYDILNLPSGNSLYWTAYNENINNYEQAALEGIEYVLDNLI